MAKLVRDYIPKILTEKGKKHVVQVLEDEAYSKALQEKLLEEVVEFNEETANKKEELADILEVIEALFTAYNFTEAEILQIKEQKKQERGAFEQKILLVELEK